MSDKKLYIGIDAGHLYTKAVLMRDKEILSYAAVPTGLNVPVASEEALVAALKNGGSTRDQLAGIITTGVFAKLVELPALATIPEHVAAAKGAFVQNNNSRTVVDLGGNISKTTCYDQNGNPLDVIQNDKCADGPGILYSTMSKALGMTEEEFSALALKTTKELPLAIQCNLAAESEAIDLLCQGEEAADVANAITKYIAERVAGMCTTIGPKDEIVFAGCLARSQALTRHISALLNKNIKTLDQPEYVGAVGAVLSYGGGN